MLGSFAYIIIIIIIFYTLNYVARTCLTYLILDKIT